MATSPPTAPHNETIAGIVKQAVGAVAGKAADGIRKIKAELPTSFAAYIVEGQQRFRTVKLLLSSAPLPVEDVYVPLGYEHRGRAYTVPAVLDAALNDRRVLISGTAGSGKSLFLKHVCATQSARLGFVPLFFELRTLNSSAGGSLLKAIADQIRPFYSEMDENILAHLLRSGRMMLLLDGHDELNRELRSGVAPQISELSRAFPKAPILITTRPGELIESIPEIAVYSCQPMTDAQLLSLVEKVPYDSDVKSAFSKALRDGSLPQTDFLQNPLLATMMLLTYRRYAEVPDKIHIFYDWAYTTLFREHDASKGVFARQMSSGLDIDDFARCFAHFCAVSYMDERFEFSETELTESLRAAIKYEGITASPSDLKHDVVSSVSLMQKDGLKYGFVHRTFQEYFTARFIASLDDENAASAIEAIVQKGRAGQVLPILKGMDEARFERLWALPTVERALKVLLPVDRVNHPERHFGAIYTNWTPVSESLGVRVFIEDDEHKELFHPLFELDGLYPRERRDDDDAEATRVKAEIAKLQTSDPDKIALLMRTLGCRTQKQLTSLRLEKCDPPDDKIETLPSWVAVLFGWTEWAQDEIDWLLALRAQFRKRQRVRANPFAQLARRSEETG